MRIEVKLYGVFRIGRFKDDVREVPRGAGASAIAEQLQIPLGRVGTVLIGGIHATLDDPLRDGDVLSLLPILGGG
jgi:molybdopterin converting factor small subunit